MDYRNCFKVTTLKPNTFQGKLPLMNKNLHQQKLFESTQNHGEKLPTKLMFSWIFNP